MNILNLPDFALATILESAIEDREDTFYIDGQCIIVSEEMKNQLKTIDPEFFLRKRAMYYSCNINKPTAKALFYGFNADEVKKLIKSTAFYERAEKNVRKICMNYANQESLTTLIVMLRKNGSVYSYSLANLLETYWMASTRSILSKMEA